MIRNLQKILDIAKDTNTGKDIGDIPIYEDDGGGSPQLSILDMPGMPQVGGVGLLPYAGFGQNVQVFTSSGTFTVPANVTQVNVTVVGAGGGAGLRDTGGGGGGGGGIAIKLVTSLTPGTNISVTVGIGGVGAIGGGSPSPFVDSGTDGGSSSFGVFCSAIGGGGGINWRGGSSGVGIGGDYNGGLGCGESAARTDSTANPRYRGGFGGGGGPVTSGAGAMGDPGTDATTNGAGGSGGNENGIGGDGADGIVIVRW